MANVALATPKTNLMQVHAQWARRPNDERFLTLKALNDKLTGRMQSSQEHVVALDGRFMQVQPVDDSDHSELQLVEVNPNTNQMVRSYGQLTNFSFGRLCSHGRAPAEFLRRLPPMFAAANLQWALEHNESDSQSANDVKLLTRTNGHTVIAAVTGPDYGRIYDGQASQVCVDYFDPEIWHVPASDDPDPIRATTLYASDRDMFIFLVNEKWAIDSAGENIKRGAIVWNSEVGTKKFGLCTFLYDYVCRNRIIWGASEVQEINIRHTSGAPHRFRAEAIPQIRDFVANSFNDSSVIEQTIRRAKVKEIAQDRDGVTLWLKARGFTLPQAKRAYEMAEADPRGYNPRSVWGLVQGLTDYAHEITHSDSRSELERKAGSLLSNVA